MRMFFGWTCGQSPTELLIADALPITPVEEPAPGPAEEPLRGRVVRAASLRAHRTGRPVLLADADPSAPATASPRPPTAGPPPDGAAHPCHHRSRMPAWRSSAHGSPCSSLTKPSWTPANSWCWSLLPAAFSACSAKHHQFSLHRASSPSSV